MTWAIGRDMSVQAEVGVVVSVVIFIHARHGQLILTGTALRKRGLALIKKIRIKKIRRSVAAVQAK